MKVNPGVVHPMMRSVLTSVRLDSSLGLRAVCVDTEGAVAGLEPLTSSSGPRLLLRPGGSEVLLEHDDFLPLLEEFRGSR